MYTNTTEYKSFDSLSLVSRCRIVRLAIEPLVYANEEWLRRNAGAPSIYESGVIYQDQAPVIDPFDDDEETDWWQDTARLLETGAGSCEDLAAWRVAELHLAGETSAQLDVIAQETGNDVLYHVRVKREDGSIEDPSVVLGMAAPPQYIATLRAYA